MTRFANRSLKRVIGRYSLAAAALVSSSVVAFRPSNTVVSLDAAAVAARLNAATAFRSSPQHCFRLLATSSIQDSTSTIADLSLTKKENSPQDDWSDILPIEKGSHGSAKIIVPATTGNKSENDDDDDNDPFDSTAFPKHLQATVTACREWGKSSLWVEVPMTRASLIESMHSIGLRFHHAVDETAVLNMWLRPDSESKIPDFSTHNVGVGAVVVNGRNEILCVRELRRNYRPWKTPTGLSELGEPLDVAAEREVLEETGIEAKFHSILGFRQTHGLAHGRSDLFFVCRLDPVEQVDAEGNVIVPEPVAQACEIEKAEWVPLDEFKAMVFDKENGHPMMQHVLEAFEYGRHIQKEVVESVVPGRAPNSIFFPMTTRQENE